MPRTASAKKALRQSARRRQRNLRHSTATSKIVKQVKKLAARGKTAEAQALLPKAYKALDKAAKSRAIKKGTAARKKSRMAHFLKKHSSGS